MTVTWAEPCYLTEGGGLDAASGMAVKRTGAFTPPRAFRGAVPVHVRLDVTEPGTHLVRVTMRFPPTGDRERRFRMAAWVPGSYKIRDFGRHVQDMGCRLDGKAARVEQTGKDEWTVRAAADREVELAYRVYCRELTVDTSHVTNDHAHLFPATLVLYDERSRGEKHRLEVESPPGWRLWSGLETPAFRGTLEDADGYDHLIDCPIECGPADGYHVATFNARRKKHRLVVWSPPEGVDWKRIVHDMRAIVEETARVFDGLPYAHYTFLAHVAKDHGGGLEHRNSTVLGLDPLALTSDEKIMTRFLPLVAHEFFHTWNVKRILPAAFRPYDLQREVYTGLLWLFEGVTSYYELPILYRAGVFDDPSWGKVVAEMLKHYEMALGRSRRPVTEASRLTWTLLYQPHEHNVNRNVSYYTKGLFVGLCLDHHLRMEGVRGGLDAVMRHLWNEYGNGRGVPEDGVARIVEEATGVDVSRVLGNWTNGTTELPVDKALRDLGWDVERALPDEKRPLGLGVHFKAATSRIERIPEDSPAWSVLQPDDELVAAEGYKWAADAFAEHAATREAGDLVRLHVFREGRLRAFDVPLREMPKDKITVKPRRGDAAATRRRKAWLGEGAAEAKGGGTTGQRVRRSKPRKV